METNNYLFQEPVDTVGPTVESMEDEHSEEVSNEEMV